MRRLMKPGPAERSASATGTATPYKDHKRVGSSSIRGRISSPIPIPSIADDDFPIRDPRTVAPMALDAELKEFAVNDAQSRFQQERQHRHQQSFSHPTSNYTTARLSEANGSKLERNSNTQARNTTSDSDRESPQRPIKRATEPRLQARDSVFVEDSADVRRSKSTLRGRVGRLFSRKNKKSLSQDTTRLPSTEKLHAKKSHKSEPIAETPVFRRSEPKGSASLPITEYDRALRSHSVGPEDVLAIESVRNSVNADFIFDEVDSGTLDDTPTIYQPSKRYTGEGRFSGLSPRPASSRRPNPAPRETGVVDLHEIGRAITSDSSVLKRRSRSLSGKPPVQETRGLKRRRSDDIRYWRESHDPVPISPMTFGTAEGEPFGVNDTAKEALAADELLKRSISPAVSPDVSHGDQTTGPTEGKSLVTQIYEDDTHTESVKEPATPQPHTPSEAAEVAEVCSDSTPKPPIPPTDLGFQQRSIPEESALTPGDNSSINQRISTTTIRGATTPHENEMTGEMKTDQYNTLVSMIEEERSARKALEAEVESLNKRMQHLYKLQMSSQHTSEDIREYANQGRHSLSLEDSGIATDSVDEESIDSFVTPMENRHDSAAFGEEEMATESAARVMSLSQLTIGTNAPTAVF